MSSIDSASNEAITLPEHSKKAPIPPVTDIIGNLPPEIIVLILKNLDRISRMKAVEACRSWKTMLYTTVSLWQEMEPLYVDKSLSAAFTVVTHKVLSHDTIKSINLMLCDEPIQFYSFFRSYHPKLQSFTLAVDRYQTPDMRTTILVDSFLRRHPHITSLKCENIPLHIGLSDILRVFPQLEDLDIHHCPNKRTKNIYDGKFARLKHPLKKLSLVFLNDFHYCEFILDELQHLKVGYGTVLFLEEYHRFSEYAIDFPKLDVLEICDPEDRLHLYADEDKQVLLPQLRTLKLSDCDLSNNLWHMFPYKNLKNLVFTRCDNLPSLFPIVADSASNLDCLTISKMSIPLKLEDYSFIDQLSKLSQITYLNVSFTKITNDFIEWLDDALPRLKSLGVENCPYLCQHSIIDLVESRLTSSSSKTVTLDPSTVAIRKARIESILLTVKLVSDDNINYLKENVPHILASVVEFVPGYPYDPEWNMSNDSLSDFSGEFYHEYSDADSNDSSQMILRDEDSDDWVDQESDSSGHGGDDEDDSDEDDSDEDDSDEDDSDEDDSDEDDSDEDDSDEDDSDEGDSDEDDSDEDDNDNYKDGAKDKNFGIWNTNKIRMPKELFNYVLRTANLEHIETDSLIPEYERYVYSGSGSEEASVGDSSAGED